MKRFWVFSLMLASAMLLLFFLVQALHLPFLEDNQAYWLSQKKWVAALAGVGLLIADVVAPVPSSIIMFVNGVLFGLFFGTLLSVVGGLGAAFCGHWIGSKGEKVAKRWMGEIPLARAHTFFLKHGTIAIIVSRPIPILAEAVSIIAGLSGMPRKRLFLASILGLVPAALLYAIAGAYAVDLDSSLYAFLVVMVLASIVYLLGRYVINPKGRSAHTRSS